jgi:hypothetical protein
VFKYLVKPEGFEIGHLSKVEFMQPRQGWLILCFLFGCIKKAHTGPGRNEEGRKIRTYYTANLKTLPGVEPRCFTIANEARGVHLSKVEFMQPRQGLLILCFLWTRGETKKEEKSEHIKQQT